MQLYYFIFLIIYIVKPQGIDQFIEWYNDCINLYNLENFEQIYNLFSTKAMNDFPKISFLNSLQQTFEIHGLIKYKNNITIDNAQQLYLVGFYSTLAVGIINWKYDSSNKLNHFHINSFSTPTLLQFIQNNPNISQVTMYYNDQKLIDHNEQSTINLWNYNQLIILIEYCRQISIGMLDSTTQVDNNFINQFYIKNFDFGHQKYLLNQNNQTITIQDLAESMLLYNSYCIAELFQMILGKDQIEQTLKNLNIEQTKQTWHVSSYLVFTNMYNQTYNDYISRISEMTYDSFLQFQNSIHNQLENNTTLAQILLETGYNDLTNGQVLSIALKYFTQSSTSNYVKLLNIIMKQKSNYLTKLAYEYFNILFYKTNQRISFRINIQDNQLGTILENICLQNCTNCYLNSLFHISTLENNKQFGISLQNLNYQQFEQIKGQYNIFSQFLLLNDQFYLDFALRLNYSENFIQ